MAIWLGCSGANTSPGPVLSAPGSSFEPSRARDFSRARSASRTRRALASAFVGELGFRSADGEPIQATEPASSRHTSSRVLSIDDDSLPPSRDGSHLHTQLRQDMIHIASTREPREPHHLSLRHPPQLRAITAIAQCWRLQLLPLDLERHGETMRIFKTLFLASLLYACGDHEPDYIQRRVDACTECNNDEICVIRLGFVRATFCVPPPKTCVAPASGTCECVIGPCGRYTPDACTWTEEALLCGCAACD